MAPVPPTWRAAWTSSIITAVIATVAMSHGFDFAYADAWREPGLYPWAFRSELVVTV
jgi:hypothetical protein